MSFTLAGMVAELAARFPEREAIACEGRSLTFAAFEGRAHRLARALEALGVGAGMRVGFLGRNSPLYLEIVTACSLLDAVLVGLNWRLSASECSAIIEDAELTLLVADPELRPLLGGLNRLDRAPPVVTTGAELDERLAAAGSARLTSPSTPASALLQLYSSGTTGRPKGIVITNANLDFTRTSARQLYGMDQDSVNLVASPLFHIGGVGYCLTALSQGGKTVLIPDAKAARLLEAIERHRVTHAFLVPTLIQEMLRSQNFASHDLSSLRTIAYGGAPMSESLLQHALKKLQCGFIGVYGMTETSGTVMALRACDHEANGPRARLLRSVGRPLPWACEVELRDPATLSPVGVGEIGEICVRSGQVALGYWNQPDATAAAHTPDGWLRTGDAAYQDSEGYYYLHDRLKDMVISGGENVYPAEVEKVLANHPEVLDVAVIGVPSETWGETVKAIVVPAPGSSLTESALIEFARAWLAHYKCPASVDFVTSLPRNATGKLQKSLLRERYRRAPTT